MSETGGTSPRTLATPADRRKQAETVFVAQGLGRKNDPGVGRLWPCPRPGVMGEATLLNLQVDKMEQNKVFGWGWECLNPYLLDGASPKLLCSLKCHCVEKFRQRSQPGMPGLLIALGSGWPASSINQC